MRRCLFALGLVLLAAALALTGYNVWDAHRADRAAQAAVTALQAAIETAPAPAEQPGVMPVLTVDGEDYIGYLSIPALELALPVMADWDYARLKVSPCRYSGSYFTGDLVIAAHNYARHFSPIKWIEPDTVIFFTAADGTVLQYKVRAVETLQPTEIERMTTAEGWDLTLFTCNTGGQTRCAVRCVRTV